MDKTEFITITTFLEYILSTLKTIKKELDRIGDALAQESDKPEDVGAPSMEQERE